jgi:hypothetical protein
MSTFTITINPNAQLAYFEHWLKATFPIFDGTSYVDGNSYIAIITSEVLTQGQRDTITTFYNALTTNDVIENLYCRVFSFMLPEQVTQFDCTLPPVTVDYTHELTQRLQPILTNVYKGEVRQIIYYESATHDAYGQLVGTNPIVKEDFVYVRDVAKMVVSRTLTISWYRNDGTVHPTTKVMEKLYSPQEKIAEGQRLRKNIIDFCQPTVLAMIMATEQVDYNTAITLGAELSNTYSNEINSWVNASRGNTLIQTVLENNTIAWLDNVVDAQGHTIRDHILDQLNY